MSNIDFMLAQEDMKKWRSPEDDMIEESDETIEELEKLKDKISDIEISYDNEDTYSKLYNACIDYQNESQNFFLEDLFDGYVNSERVEEIAKRELENGGLERLQCFLGRDIFKIDAYGNLSNIEKDELELLKEDIIDAINDEINKNI